MTEPITCSECKKREGICTPVVYVPIKLYPTPLYMQYRGVLCQQCANVFTLKRFTEMYGAVDWYTVACDQLRSVRKPAANPYPDDPSFKWEEFILNPNWEPAPREECTIKFWRRETLAAKGAHQTWSPLKR